MKCYYEELGVPREASDADIKTAYRKLALRWHPDKNPDCAEEAKEKFQLIQQAYDVLSDSHERAWYDNHREQILRGKNSEYEENCLDLFQYFTVSCFKGYGDDAKGFYKVYAEVFEKIAAEDAEFMEDEEEVAEIPKFGDSTSSYEEVVGPFYAYWQSYCTKKTYTWLCPYDIQEIKDRRILREIEKELKKVVQKAKRERNEEVRNLVSFIRKRDKRVQAYKKLLEERAALNRQKQEQNRLEQIRKRNRELEEMRKNNSQTFNEGYEEQLKQLEQQYGVDSCDEGSEEDFDENDGAEQLNGDVSSLHLEEEEEYVDDLYCVACNRAFKNEKAFGNHETSKKHRENVERLRQEMLEEEDLYGESEETADDCDEDAEIEKKEVLDDANLNGAENVDLVAEEDTEDTADLTKSTKSSKKSKKSKKTNKSSFKAQLQDSDEEEDFKDFSVKPPANEESDDDWGNSGKKGGKKSKNKPAKGKSSDVKEMPKESPPKVEPPATVTATATQGPPEASAAHMCVTCKSAFESKNKLFAHLKKTNHGVYIPKGKPEAADTGKKAKGKRK